MKIGIVTQPLHNNYGGLLQNYALQYVLKKRGHEIKTIDFIYRQSITKYILSLCKNILISTLKLRKPQLRTYIPIPIFRNNIMEKFVNKYIIKTPIVHRYTSNIIDKECFEVIITGSDQVWRPIYNVYLEDMFLKFVPDNIRKVAYAASFGVDTWEYDGKRTKRCSALAKRFNAISVRETSGVNLCQKYLNVNATCVLDPTLLAGREAYLPLISEYSGNDYLFAYILDIRPEKEEYIRNIAKDYGLDVRIYGAEQNATLSVEEWLSMIANASMVVTDSFHGTVFSILFHRNFYSIVNAERGGTRFKSLLSPLGLDYRLVDDRQFKELKDTSTDWQYVDAKLERQRTESLNFLINALI